MALNSDAITNVLEQFYNNLDKLNINKVGYRNVINMAMSDDIDLNYEYPLFPENELLVDRLADDFVAKNIKLLNEFKQKTRASDYDLASVWITSSHILSKHCFMLELTFESSEM